MDPGAGAADVADIERVKTARVILGFRHANGPKRHLVRGAVLTGGLLPLPQDASQAGLPGNCKPLRQTPLGEIRTELHQCHRGRGRQVVRVHRLENGLGEPGELRVELQVDTGSEKREAFEQALDVRIDALDFTQAETTCDLWELFRELARHPPQVLQFAVVIT